jgi:hypothetical protein
MVEGRWVANGNWELNGRGGEAASFDADNDGGDDLMDVSEDKAQLSAPTPTDSAIPSATATSAPVAASQVASLDVTTPSGWTDNRARTPYYAIPLILSLSIFLAVGMVVAMFVVVWIKRKRRRSRRALEAADTESAADAEKAGEKPTTRRGRFTSAVKRRTAGLRRRKRPVLVVVSARPAARGDDEASDDGGDEPVIVEAASSSLSLHRQPTAASQRSVSTVAPDPESDADSVTALTDPSATGSRRYPSRRRSLNPTSVFTRPRPTSVVSVASLHRLPPAPPAYGHGPSSSSRRDEKRRAVEQADGEDDDMPSTAPPPLEEADGRSIDRTEVSGHVATDEKEAMRRLAELASAPDEVDSNGIEVSAPDADDVDASQLALALDDSPSSPASSPPSALPAPPAPIEASFTGLAPASRPSAPPAPWLPQYEPSAPAYEPAIEGDGESVDNEGDGGAPEDQVHGGRRDHAVV